MERRRLAGAWAALGLVLAVSAAAMAQQPFYQVLYSEDFERGGALTPETIARYPIKPQVVDSDPVFPGAFPPPSGRFAARAQDPQISYYGLGAVVGGPVINLADPAQANAAFEVKLYVPPQTEVFSDNNVSILALDESAKVEHYYRFGMGRNNLYFHYFDGNTFKESLYDPILAGALAVPGWHTFTIRFAGPGKFYCLVDGKAAAFSPVEQQDLTQVRLGALGWDKERGRPLLVDDMRVLLYPGPLDPAELHLAAPRGPFEAAPPGAAGAAAPLVWHTDPVRAVAEAQTKTAPKFLTLFYLEGNALSAQLERETLASPAARAALSRFTLVKLEGQRFPDVARRYAVFRYPTLTVLDMEGRIYWEYRGLLTPEELTTALARY